MTQANLVRLSGLAAAVGGAVFMISMLTPLRGLSRVAVPGSVVCMMLGTVGLYSVLHGRRRGQQRLGLQQLGLVLAGIGLALGILGMTVGDALGPLSPWGRLMNTGEHVGLVFIGAAMGTWGVLAVQTSALGRWSFTPIPIGVCGLVGLTSLRPTTFDVMEAGPLPLLFSGAWILLGLGLLISGSAPHRDSQASPAGVSTTS